MNGQILKVARKFVAEDISVIVPDFYRGKVGKDREMAGHLMHNLDFPKAVQDIAHCCDYLKTHGCQDVYVTGYCMGGALSLLSICRVPGLAGASSYYGIPSALSDADLSAIGNKPLQLHYGSADESKGFSSPSDYAALSTRLNNHNVTFKSYEYKDQPHGFVNPLNKGDPAAAQLALSRTFQFFLKKIL